MTMLWPAQNNRLNIFARSEKSQSLKDATRSHPDRAFKNTLAEASRRRPAQAEAAENRRPAASEAPRRAEKPEPAERKQPAARSADEPAEAREAKPDRKPDDAATNADRETVADSQPVGEARSEAAQTGEPASTQRQESTEPAAQQPSESAQGLHARRLAGEVLSNSVQPVDGNEPQSEQIPVVMLPVEGDGETAGVNDAQPASTTDQTAAPAAVSNQTGESSARTVLESMVTMPHDETTDQKRTGAEDVGTGRPAAASQTQEQARPVERPAGAQQTTPQSTTDQLSRIIEDRSASEQQTTSDDRGSKEDGPQESRWTLRGDNAAASTPAVARAARVDAGVKLENATSQAPTGELGARTIAGAMPMGQVRIDSPTSAGQITASADDRAGSARNMADAPFTGRVIRGLSAMINQQGGVMNMRLEPPEMGDLRVQMTIARGQVSAQFHVTTAEAQSMLEKSMGSLRAALESHGLTIERLQVHLPSSSSSRDMPEENSEQQQQQQSRGHTDAGGGQSRGRGEGEESLNHQRSPRHAGRPFAEAFASAPHAE